MVTWHTALNTSMSPRLSNVGFRMMAFLLDAIIIGTLGIVIMQLSSWLSLPEEVTFILSIPLMLYTLLFEYFYEGRTPGKVACQLQVVHEKGLPITFTMIFLRWVLRLIDVWLYSLGLFVALITPRRQRLGGLISETMVIRLPKSRLAHSLPTIRKPTSSYKPFYVRSKDISAKDMQVVHDVLKLPMSPKRTTLSDNLADRIKDAYNITTTDHGRTFLIRLKQDYLELSALEA